MVTAPLQYLCILEEHCSAVTGFGISLFLDIHLEGILERIHCSIYSLQWFWSMPLCHWWKLRGGEFLVAFLYNFKQLQTLVMIFFPLNMLS